MTLVDHLPMQVSVIGSVTAVLKLVSLVALMACVKPAQQFAANNGATAHQLMAIFGWDTLKMAEHYTRSADQQRLAMSAMRMLDTQEQTRTESCPTESPGGTISAKA